MKALETDDNEQRHAAFLVYMDLSEGECRSCLAFSWSNHTDSQLCWIKSSETRSFVFFPLQIVFEQKIKYKYLMELYT